MGRPDAVEPVECAAEVELVLIADSQGDLLDEHAPLATQLKSGLHPASDNIRVDRFAAPLAMESVEVVWGHAR